MTQEQYASLIGVLRRIDAHTEEVAERLRFVFPTDREIRRQIDSELQTILATDCGVKPFAG